MFFAIDVGQADKTGGGWASLTAAQPSFETLVVVAPAFFASFFATEETFSACPG